MTKDLKKLVLTEKALQEHEKLVQREKRLRERKAADAKRRELLQHLRLATNEEYVNWLKERIVNFGTENLAFFRNPADYFFALEPFPVTPLYGADALKIIVPKNIKLSYNREAGHNVFYLPHGIIFPSHSTVEISEDDLLFLE